MSAVRSRSSVMEKGGGSSQGRKSVTMASACSLVVDALTVVLLFTSHNASAGAWDIQIVDPALNVGQYTSIAVDAAGLPRIGYQSAANGDVKYARFDGTDWHIERVGSFFSVGQFLSMALDRDDRPHLSYYNGSGNSLEYARWNGSAWITTTVDSGGVVGWYTSIAVNASGFARIAYYDAGKHDLKFAKFNGSGWMIETIDSTGDVGAYASIALNSSDNPSISYYDATNGDLKVATLNASAWEIGTVDSDGDVGKFISLVLGVDESVHISYYDATHVHLKYARLLQGIWNMTTVDTKNFVGPYSSTKVDAAGNARISYYDDSASTLRYARWNGSAWNIEVVDGPGAGSFSSIAIDSGGYTHISYYDIAGKRLRYSKGVGNEAPAVPSQPSGPTPVIAFQPRAYSTIALDPEDDFMSFIFSWGDASTSQTGYLGPGVSVNVSHKWSVRGTYAVKVMAIDVHGMQSWWSDPLTVEVFELPRPPQYLDAVGGSGQVSLTWYPPTFDGGSPITGYDIRRGTASGHENLLASTSARTYNDSDVINGMTYFYTVRARTIFGESSDSNEDSAMPLAVPGAPTGLRAVAGDSQVMLNWTAPSDAGGTPITSYFIYRGITAGEEWLLASMPVTFIYLDSEIENGITYYYIVRAMNSVGLGPSSEEVNATPVTRPSPPRNLLGTTAGHEVNLTWYPPASNGGSPIVNYTIYRGEWWNAESPLHDIGNVTTFTDVGLAYGRKYFYVITATNAAGRSDWSNELQVTVCALPTQPVNLTAISGDSEVMLTWSPPVDNGGFVVSNYSVWRGLSPGQKTLIAVLGDTLRYRDTLGVMNGATYFYTVSATTLMGTGPNSTEVNATPSTIPSEPLNLKATMGGGQVALSWEAPVSDGGSPITGYTLWWGLVSNCEIYAIDVGNSTSHVHVDLVNGATYFYRIAARNSRGEGPRSVEASAMPATIPGMPTGLTAVAGDGKITLSWQPPADRGGIPIINYTVFRALQSEAETYFATIADTLSYIDSGLVNGLTYYYKVAAVNGLGEGPPSVEASAMPSARPGAPRYLTATGGDHEVSLSWTAPASDGGFAISGYEVSRGVSADAETLLVQIGNITAFVDTGIENGRTYFYKVRAINLLGRGPESGEASATTGSVPGRPAWLVVDVGYRHAILAWASPADDGGFPVTGYEVRRGNSPGSEVLLEQLGPVFEYRDSGLDNGATYYYTVAAVNSLGSGIASYEVGATPHDMPPVCTISAPAWGLIVSGEVNITGAASDDSGVVERVEVRIDDGEWMNATGAISWAFEWGTEGLDNGQHIIQARSYDGHNYSEETLVSVKVDNPVPLPFQEESVLSQPWFYVVTATVTFMLIALLVILIRRRRGGAKTDKAMDEDEALKDLLTLKL